jgi:hypothetical protein
MTQPFLVFPLPANGPPAFGGTINPAKLNRGDRLYTLCSAFGALNLFVPAAGSTFATNFPAWGPFAAAQGVQAIAGPGGRMSLWVDPTSSSYVLVLNSLLTAGALPTGLAALGDEDEEEAPAPKGRHASHGGKEHSKHSWSKEDIRHEDEPEDDKPRSRR